MTDTTPARGQLRRQDKAMTEGEAAGLLASAFCGRTGTLGPDGFPYVVPNLFVFRDGRVYLHTGRVEGHFLANVRFHDRVSFEVDEPGEIFPYGPVECDTSVSFRSVIVFGRIRIVDDPDEIIAFYRAFMEKYAPGDSWGREKGSFPRTGATVVYAITPEKITGKEGRLPVPAGRWTAANGPVLDPATPRT
ncbi:MAG TPA: pyridoxamine 5'-phosphate oxidase family protein [Deinococcales bacterium]|nr:pyridoxamine 5'-phosphate oxidase family protein [Deinococcales bacterium]